MNELVTTSNEESRTAQVSSAEYIAAVEALLVSIRSTQRQQLENSSKRMNIFEFVGSAIRTIVRDGEPWFVANDVADVLGYVDQKQAVRDHCKYQKLLKGVESEGLTSSPYGITIIPERDVYRLIMRSKLPSAERFEEWVVSEVLPAIRRTGSYSPQPQPVAPQTYAEALMQAGAIQLEIERLELETKQLAQIGYQVPMAMQQM
jgi:prophage antirepressor-like protein